MAEVIARDIIAKSGADIQVTSPGVGANPGDFATDDAQIVASEHGLHLSAHRAQRLTGELVATADLIIAMKPEHADAAEALGASRVVMIGRIRDPMGQGLSAYRETFALLAERVPGVLC